MKDKAIILILFALFLSSCIENVDIASNLDRKLTVNCILSGNDSIQYLDLKYSGLIGDIFYDHPETADIRLFSDDIEVGRFECVNPSRWKLNYKPIAGARYKLLVSVPGEKQISAETIMPEIVPVFRRMAVTGNLKYFSQSFGTGPYWMYILSKRGAIYDYEVPSDFSDYYISEFISSDHPALDGFNSNGRKMYSILGLDTGNFPEHSYYLRIAQTDNEDEFQFAVEGNLSNSIVVIKAVSCDYDKYLKSSILKMREYEDPDDFTSHFEENVVYSNIKGGLGIFGACFDKYIIRNPLFDRIVQ